MARKSPPTITWIQDRSIPEPNTGCWIWNLSVNKDGYGVYGFNYQRLLAHRLAWWAVHGEEPALNVLHRCDTPTCVNPDHLFLGTQADNARDMVRKGRSYDRRGSKHHNALLDEGIVSQIRDLAARKAASHREIARKFSVRIGTIRDVIYRKSWKHV